VRNAGPNDAASVALTDAVPSGSTFVSWSQNSGPAFNCSTPAPGATGTINCTIGVLPGFEGKTTTAEFVLTVDTAMQVTNTASVSSSTADPRPDNNTSTFPVLAKISIDDVIVVEGNIGTTPAVFTVTLQPANATLTATVDYQTTNGTATAGSDFLATAGTLTFLAGETTKTITVPVIGDSVVEGNESFNVQLSNAVNATFQDTVGVGTIIDDDLGGPPPPSVRIGNLSFPEGNSGTFNVTFTATLSAASTNVSRVRWQTQDGTATAGSDYIAASGELVFQPGDLMKTFTVAIIGDTNFEPDESFNILIVSTDNTSTPPGPAAVGTIVNDDVQVPPRHRAASH
jgi:chitinase